jgi:poly(hydroxyalkanoate) depolymerase family esterase
LKIQQAPPVAPLRDSKTDGAGPSRRQFDPGAIGATIERALAAAGLNTRAGPMKGVTDTIHQALSAAGLTQRSVAPSERGVTIDGTSREIDAESADIDAARAAPDSTVDAPVAGTFLSRSLTNQAGTRAYMLYVPASYARETCEPVPVVVMLHGCTQSPADFAAGTRMNALADRHGFLVIYPGQSANANGSKCWNWFRREDQVRDSGEPSIIADITREIAADYRVDVRRIFVAGMSAGASMAVVLGALYPDLYAGVGAHSGLAYGAAHDMPSAFAAMHGGPALAGRRPPSSRPDRSERPAATPTIVFHGDQDRTVNARNGEAIVEQVASVGAEEKALRAEVKTGTAPGGRKYRRTDYVDQADQSVVEHWMVHGAGHAWSGGSPDGSYTDPMGPDASAEMIRFFLSQRKTGTA